MLPDRVSNPGPLTYMSGALPIALLYIPAMHIVLVCVMAHLMYGFRLHFSVKGLFPEI